MEEKKWQLKYVSVSLIADKTVEAFDKAFAQSGGSNDIGFLQKPYFVFGENEK
ncbi:MAG: hypothetical protein ACLT3H_03140 [Roseburia sp.]